MRTQERRLRDAYQQAQSLHRHHGKSYYFATQLFPRDLREATYSLYAFFRVPDEIVDNSPQETAADRALIEEKLIAWRDEWQRAYQTRESSDPLLFLTAHTFHSYRIPFEYSTDFISAMIQDVHQTRYANYEELRQYMWGSAAVVGLMMSYVIGYTGEKTLEHAAKLGYAMQLTNFLRDIEEDWDLRGRIYMPLDELKQYGLGEDDIAQKRYSPHFRDFMLNQAARAHTLYEEAEQGIPNLNAQGRSAVCVASTLYRAILGKLERQGWDPFAGRARTGFHEKVLLSVQALRKNY